MSPRVLLLVFLVSALGLDRRLGALAHRRALARWAPS